MYIFKVNNSFHICLHPLNHHYNQDNSEFLSFIKISYENEWWKIRFFHALYFTDCFRMQYLILIFTISLYYGLSAECLPLPSCPHHS